MLEGKMIDLAVTIEKTDVKIYTVQCSIDMDDVIKFVDANYGSYHENEIETLDDPMDEPECTEDEYYEHYIGEYMDYQDADLLLTDNCHSHKVYHLESEECSLKSFSKIEEGA